MTGSLGDDARRAIALVTALYYEDPAADSNEFIWDLIGTDDEERLNTVSVLAGMMIGIVEGTGGDMADVLQYMASNVYRLDGLS